MTFSIRVRRLFLFFLTFTLFASTVAYGASPDSAKAREKLEQCVIGSRVKLKLADHSKVKGKISAIREDAVDVLPRGAKAPVTVPLDQVASASVRSEDSLGSRFKMGPCVGPITLAIASPFILVAALFGH